MGPSLRERLDAQARAVLGRDRAALHVGALIVQLLRFVRPRLRSWPPELGIELVAEEGMVGRPRSFRMMLRFIRPARLLTKLPAALVRDWTNIAESRQEADTQLTCRLAH